MNTLISEPERLKVIGAYWNANITEGADRGFSIRLEDDLPRTAHQISQLVKLFESQPQLEREAFLFGAVYEQLRVASRLMWSTLTDGCFIPAMLSRHDQALVMVCGLLNIAIFQTQGLLVSDDNNGMLYMYSGGGKEGNLPMHGRRRTQSRVARTPRLDCA